MELRIISTKPVPVSVLRERLARLLHEARRRNRGNELENQMLKAANFEGMIGRSATLLETSSRIIRVAPHYRTALITGETVRARNWLRERCTT